MRELLWQGADANAKNNRGESALMYAGDKGREAIVRELLEQNEDANAKNGSGETVLTDAAQNGHAEIVRILETAEARG